MVTTYFLLMNCIVTIALSQVTSPIGCFTVVSASPVQFSQFSSVVQSCPTLCDPMDCSMPGLSVHRQLPDFTQTHVHWIDDVIQPSHPLLSPFTPAFNLSQHQGLCKWVSSSASVLPMNIQDWFPLGWTGWISMQSRDSKESSPTP